MGGGDPTDLYIVEDDVQWSGLDECKTPDTLDGHGEIWTMVSSSTVDTEDTELELDSSESEDTVKVVCLPVVVENVPEAELDQGPGDALGDTKPLAKATTKSLSPGFQLLDIDAICDVPPLEPLQQQVTSYDGAHCTADFLGDETILSNDAVSSRPQPDSVGASKPQGLYKLMHIKTDKIDTSLVEKLFVSPEQIVALCQGVLAESASFEDGTVKMDFESLNQASVHVIGLYGSKLVLRDIFERLEVVEGPTLEMMASDKLETGLYGILCRSMLYVFYWHQGQYLQEGSRHSCNFIRYVADLCETVYVCLDDKALHAPCLSSGEGMKLKRKQRTQRLKVAMVKDSENALSLHPGFQVHPEILASPGDSEEINAGLDGPREPRLKLCEGRHRAGLLYPICHPSQRTKKSHQTTVTTQNLPATVQAWLKSYNLDLSHLPKQSLSLFLQHAALQESEAFCELLRKAASRIKADQNLVSDLGKRVQDGQQLIEKGLHKCLQAYREVYHSEDEKILLSSGVKLGKPQARGSLTVIQGNNTPEACAESMASSVILQEAGAKLCKVWAGDDRQHDEMSLPSLIFVGSEVIVEAADADLPVPMQPCDVFIVDIADGGSASSLGPAVLGRDLIFRLKGAHTVHRLVLHALQGECQAGPITTFKSLRCQLQGSQSKCWPVVQLKLVAQPQTMSGMVKWIQSFISVNIPSVHETAAKLSFLILNPEDVGAKTSEFVKTSAQEVAASSDPLNLFNFYFSNARICEFLERSSYASARQSVYQCSEALQACLLAYERAWSDVGTRLVRAVKKYIVPSLRSRIQFEMKQTGLALQQSLKGDEEEYLQCVETWRLGAFESSSTLTLTGCSLQVKKNDSSKYSQKRGLGRLLLEYTGEFTEPERITWNVVELTPMKKDLEKLAAKNDIIVPKCSVHTKLINVEASEKVLLVVLIQSGEVLVVVQDMEESGGRIYVTKKLGMEVRELNLVKVLKKGCDLVAYDECLQYLALYDRSSSKISILRFRDTFRKLTWVDCDLQLDDLSGSTNLISLMFIPDKKALVLIDDVLTVRVFEFAGAPMIRPRAISLPRPFGTAKVSRDGSCLLVFNVPNDQSEAAGQHRRFLSVDVYLLDDTMASLKSIQLEHLVLEISDIDVAIVGFGAQLHLVLLDTSDPAKGLNSHIMKISLASEVRRLQKVAKSGTAATDSRGLEQETHTACAPLDYLYRIFDKYATSPPLAEKVRDFQLHVILGGHESDQKDGLQEKCEQYVKSLLMRLENEEGKSFSKLNYSVTSDILSKCAREDSLRASLHSRNVVSMGDWMRMLVCLVPIQIARAENNTLTPLVDGLEMSSNHDYCDAVSLSNSLRFGLYDAVLENWRQPIKVISSMGKQSSGKSYLLNHLSGSVLDVAGGRCTDGVWMTMRPSQHFLYVLLDFEGLGSFERSDQEDVLLSVLNAAVSNMTIFNKKDFNLDKDTEAVFERFQNAVSLVKQDSRLFKGLFYIAIKDVVSSDVDELKEEFITKIERQCEKSEESFLTKMYGGHMVVAAMPPIQRKEYHESVKEIAEAVGELDTFFPSGRQFAADFKLITAQISTRDWSAMDSKRVTLKIDLLKKHLYTAINWGSLLKDAPLTNFDTDEVVPDTLLEAGSFTFEIPDTGLELFTDDQDKQAIGSIIQSLREKFESIMGRSGDNDELWHGEFENFLLALADRRRNRILEWLQCNTEEFAQDGDALNLRLEATSTLAELKQGLSLCSCKCKSCSLFCVLEKGHTADHNCMGSHICTQACTYCINEGRHEDFQNECSHPSGHEGAHDCKVRTHCCGKQCWFLEQSPNCTHVCALKPNHDGEHRCNTKHHLCGDKCSLPSCANLCAVPLDFEHDHHKCHEKMCPMNCIMEGCRRTCGSSDHFHSLVTDKHLCDNEHKCNALCSADGLCDVHTEVVNKQMFSGKRSCFEIEHVSQQTGIKKNCCLPIPAGKEQHEGPHCHSTNPDAAHTCQERCKACGYYCSLPVNHRGKHETAHGNMTNVRFVSEEEDIDISDRKYAWGDSGKAEMCMLHCKAQGRGHIHLAECQANNLGNCQRQYKGARHERRPYGPDFDRPKDELTHAMYWEEMGFKDPCPDEDRTQFELCNHYCKSAEHTRQASEVRSYCTQPLWHLPVRKTDTEVISRAGYITEDGHVFPCRHSHGCTQHIIFVIDKSKSMSQDDIFPTLGKFCAYNRNRLGAVFEAISHFLQTRARAGQQDIISIILFNDESQIVVEMQPNRSSLADDLLRYYPRYGTNYSSGLEKAAVVIDRAAHRQANIDPVIIFFSDGRNANGNYPVDAIHAMRKQHPQLIVHTLLFGNRTDTRTLDRMATAGGGTFKLSLTEVQLARSFEQLANSLRPQVASLINSVFS